MEGEGGESFILWDCVLLAEILCDIKRCECASVFLEGSSVVATEEPVFVCVAIVSLPFKIKPRWEFHDSFRADGNAVSNSDQFSIGGKIRKRVSWERKGSTNKIERKKLLTPSLRVNNIPISMYDHRKLCLNVVM